MKMSPGRTVAGSISLLFHNTRCRSRKAPRWIPERPRAFQPFLRRQDAVAGFQIVAHAGHQARNARAFRFQIGDAQIVQEEKGITSGGKDVVDVHGHEVLAGGFHHVQFKEDFRLGAYAVASGDDDGFLIGTQVISGGKETESLVQRALFLCSFNVRTDVGYKSCRFLGIDPRLLIG